MSRGGDLDALLIRETFLPRLPEPAADFANCEGAPANPANPANLPISTPEPEPLFRPLPEGAAFPVAALGNALAGAVHAICDVVQCAPATAAGSVLAAASLAVQGLADVVLPIGEEGQPRPASLFLLTVCPSGERKSTADRFASQAIAEYEADLAEGYQQTRHSWQNEHDAWDAARKRALKLGKGTDWREAKRALDAIGPEPEAPMAPIITASEPTMPGLVKLFASARPALGLMSDEGGQMLGGWQMQRDNRTAGMAMLNSLWDGTPLKRVRALDGADAFHGRRLAVHLMAQPGIAQALLGDPEAAEIGLLARFLCAAPAELAGTRLQRSPSPDTAPQRATYERQLAGILRLPLPTKASDCRHLLPRRLGMTDGAVRLWKVYADRCEQRIGPAGDWRQIRAWGSKGAEHAARLAAVTALFHDPQTAMLDDVALARGMALADFYGGEMLRLCGNAAISAELRDADALRCWIEAQGLAVVASSQVLQFGPASLRTAAKARAALELLTVHGWLVPVAGGATIDGRQYRHVWQVVQHGRN